MYYKVIIQGRLEFGNPKSYGKVVKMYDYRYENYYKNQLIFESEEIFSDEDLSMEIPRHVTQVTEKSFKNTSSLLDYCAQFAVAGSIRAWQIDEGKIMHYAIIEPESDKVAVRSFLKGRKLVKQIGKEDEAIKALSKAIEKYNRHAQAYERRAKVNFLLKKYHDAKRDYTKCINIDPTIPTAYYGRAKVHLLEENHEEAIKDLTMATKFAIALQTVYWKAKRLKANSHMELKQWEKAAFDLKFFSKRKFDEDDPNFPWKKWAYHNYGVCLLELKEYKDALDAFNESLEYDEGLGNIEESETLRLRGIAKKKAGKTGFLKDLKTSAKMGNKQAKSLLKEMA